ncbi:MAG: 4'-phosphopantetheinyl transferase superfamily protein [Acidobacteriota bacterium]
MRTLALPPSWEQRVLVVTAIERPERWFEPGEIPSFPLEKRRMEWMLSRIAAKELAQRIGAPQMVASHSPTLSLSHTRGFGAAAIDERPIGVDIESPREIKRGAAHLFLDDEETRVMDRCTLPLALLHFWCAKEAAWKQAGGKVTTLKQIRLRLEEETPSGLRFDCAETFTSDVIVAVTRK